MRFSQVPSVLDDVSNAGETGATIASINLTDRAVTQSICRSEQHTRCLYGAQAMLNRPMSSVNQPIDMSSDGGAATNDRPD